MVQKSPYELKRFSYETQPKRSLRRDKMKNQSFISRRYRSTLLAGILLCGVAVPGVTSANLITNGSFETPTTPTTNYLQYFSGSSFDGWTVVGAAGNVALVSSAYTSVGFSFPAQDGNQWLDLTGLSNTKTGIQQAVGTSIGTDYDLSFWVGNQIDSSGVNYGISSTVEVLLDGASLGSFTNSGGDATTKIQNWKQFTLSFTASSTSSVIQFLNSDGVGDSTNGLDNVALLAQGSAPVPEPATMLLFGAGIAGLAAVGRRKRS